MVKMARPYREIFFKDFHGSIKELRAFITIAELTCKMEQDKEEYEEKRKRINQGLPLLKHVYCERVKNNKVVAEIEDISINRHNELHGLIWIKDKNGELVAITDIRDRNKNNPIFYISDTQYKNFSINPDALAAYCYDEWESEYHDCIHKALREYCKQHFNYMYDMIQLVQNKRYLEMIK